MSWKLARSLAKLREQINAAFPNRDRSSDGSIGDVAHRKRKSDHNPNAAGVVCAIDIDEDLNADVTLQQVVDAICASRDPRVNYIIYEGRITVAGSELQRWKKYTGKNAHSHHAHISVHQDPKLYDSAKQWKLDFAKTSSATASIVDQTTSRDLPTTAANDNPTINEQSPTESKVTQEQGDMTVEVTAKNEQDVTTPARVSAPSAYMEIGFWGVIKRDLAAATGGNLSFSALAEYAQQASGWPDWVVGMLSKLAIGLLIATFGYFIFRVVHYVVDTHKKNVKTRIEADAATSTVRKDIEWQ